MSTDVMTATGCSDSHAADSLASLTRAGLTLDADSGEFLDGILPICRLCESEDLDLATLRQWAQFEGRNERTT